ncbi:MAG: MBL fold metallo-hydrolase [Ruminococcaceae bacterium]|nr:MBL fold metallo-hydrolase [Oscillospiraceae bacterium]
MFARLRERVIAVWRRWWALIVAVALILCFISEQTGLTDRLLVLCGVADPHLPPKDGELQVHTLDVGNADALVLFCDGKTMLIDAGEHNDGDNVTEYLQHLGVTHLTYVIATHADADHIGGMREVLENFTVGEYLMATMPYGAEPTTATYWNLLSFLEERQIKVTETKPGMERRLGGAVVEILAPVVESEDSNEQSVVCMVNYGDTRFLFMGDAGESVEGYLFSEDLHADFLKVSHHGAENATGENFLRRVSPTVAVISCGRNNPYGHPAAAVLSRLEQVGASVYRTDRDGHIVVTSDGKTLQVTTETE